MTWLASIRIALRALRVNKLRSTLTMLGIIIGVAAVTSGMTLILPDSFSQTKRRRVSPGGLARQVGLVSVIPGNAVTSWKLVGGGSDGTLIAEFPTRKPAAAPCSKPRIIKNTFNTNARRSCSAWRSKAGVDSIRVPFGAEPFIHAVEQLKRC
jgi:hypothetical protein